MRIPRFERVPRRNLLSGGTPGWALGVTFFCLAIYVAYALGDSFPASFTFCPLRRLLDLPCPFCGGTRAAASLLRGDFAAALAFNPLLVILGCGMLLWGSLWMASGRRLSFGFSPRVILVGFLAALLLNWIYVLASLQYRERGPDLPFPDRLAPGSSRP